MISRTAASFKPLGVLAAVCFAALTACANGCTIVRYYENAPLHGDPSQLVEGQSTKSEVLQRFGPPTQITHQTDGDVFVYVYSRENSSTFTVTEPFTRQRIFTYRREFDNRDTLVVIFDFTGVVHGVAVDHQTEEMPVL